MSTGKDPAGLRVVRDLFFWIGVVMVAAALTVVALSNTVTVSRWERQTVPLSWILAGTAILALFVAERCNANSHHAPSRAPEPQPEPEDAETAGMVHSGQ